jgi:hypothetical protein
MSDTSLPQEETKVKCEVEWCDEDAWRDGLCWFHFCEEKIEEWDNQGAERQASEQGRGYMFGDPADINWFGYAKEALS